MKKLLPLSSGKRKETEKDESDKLKVSEENVASNVGLFPLPPSFPVYDFYFTHLFVIGTNL